MDSKLDTHEIEKLVLSHLKDGPIENTEQFSAVNNVSKDELDPVLKSLNVDEYLKLEVIERKEI